MLVQILLQYSKNGVLRTLTVFSDAHFQGDSGNPIVTIGLQFFTSHLGSIKTFLFNWTSLIYFGLSKFIYLFYLRKELTQFFLSVTQNSTMCGLLYKQLMLLNNQFLFLLTRFKKLFNVMRRYFKLHADTISARDLSI